MLRPSRREAMYDEDPSGATQIYNADDPALATEWSVNISDDETRAVRPYGEQPPQPGYARPPADGQRQPQPACARPPAYAPAPPAGDDEDDMGSTMLVAPASRRGAEMAAAAQPRRGAATPRP